MDAGTALTLVQAAFPAVGVRSIRPLAAGWANETFLADDALVFRFPKTDRATTATREELRLMPELAPTLSLPVPDYAFAAPTGIPGFDQPFGGYRLVPGEPLANHPGTALAPTFAAAVSEFLSTLHAFPAATATHLGVPGGTPADWRAEHLRWQTETMALVGPYLEPRERLEVAAFSLRFVQDDRNYTFTPVLLHRDLSPDHLLCDLDSGTLTGVIDFEEASMGDPAFDFIGVAHLGPAVLDRYRGPRDGGFAHRMHFYTRLWPLHELRYGVEAGLAAHVRNGLNRLRRDLAQQA